MRRFLFGTLVSLTLIALLPVSAVAQAEMSSRALSPAEIVVMGPALDGSEVVVEGEAVGDVLRARGGGSWVNVLGNEVGLGIWMTAEMVEQIEHFGHYKHSGDRVRVTGTLNRTCEEHGGEFDVHAQDLEILSLGKPRIQTLHLAEAITGLVGCLIGLALWLRRRAILAAA